MNRIEALAEFIRSNWLEWESEADQLSTSAQDSRAGEEHLHRLLVDAIEKAFPGQCEHAFVFLRTAKWTDDSGAYNTHFNRVDEFFCSKCLEQKEARKDEYSRDTPDWYRS